MIIERVKAEIKKITPKTVSQLNPLPDELVTNLHLSIVIADSQASACGNDNE